MPVSQGSMIKSFVSAIDFLDQRDIDPNIYDQSRDKAFTDIMKMVNRYKPATMFNYHNFVNSDVYEIANISAITTNAAKDVVFTINTAVAFPRVGDLIMTKTTGKQLLITAVTIGATTNISASSVDGSVVTLVIGDDIAFSSNAFPEKSDAPTNRRYGLEKYFNLIQIFREVDEISDIQKVAKIEVNVGGDYHILPYQTVQKYIKLQGDISVQMLAGVQSKFSSFNNPSASNLSGGGVNGPNGLPVQTTGGLDWYVTTYGINDRATTAGTFGFTELDDIIDNFIAFKAPTDQMVFMGSKAYRIISKFLKNLGSAGVTSVRLMIDGRKLDFEVEHLSYGGYEFDFIHVPIFDHPQLFSTDLRPDVNGSMYFVPKDQVDTVDNGRQPRMQIRHTPTPFMGNAANKSANGIITEWRTGALAEIPTSSTMQLHTDWETGQGLECLAVKHFQKYQVTGF